MPYDFATGLPTGAITDGMATQSAEDTMAVDMLMYNGVSRDRVYNNTQAILVPAGARNAAPAIPTQANPNGRGVYLFLNVTASPATAGASLTLSLRAIEPVTGMAFVTLLTGAAIVGSVTANSATGLYTYLLYPTAGAGVTLAVNGVLPRVWGANVAHATADSWTYSLAASAVL